MSAKPHLVCVSHIGGHTGLARVADNLLSRLAADWRITIIAISMPYANYTVPWATVIPAPRFLDWMGRLVLADVVRDDPPDVTVAYMDPWVLEEFVKGVDPGVPLVGYLPVDGYNMRAAPVLDRLTHAIFLSPFALGEARLAGYAGPASVVGHGVDTAVYHPMNRAACREALGLPQDAMIIGNVGQNQPRKRWDLTLEAFQRLADGWAGSVPLYLYCHCKSPDMGWDLPQLVRWMGLEGSVLFPRDLPDCGYPESQMPLVYNSFDLQWTTTWGEGFGLTTLEGMACGIPQIVPTHTALQDWARPAAWMLDADTRVVAPGGQNLIGYTLSPGALASSARALLTIAELRAGYGARGLALAQSDAFRWETCAAQMHAILQQEVASRGVTSGV